MISRIVASAACTALLFTSSVAFACPNAGDGSGSGSASNGATAAAKKKKCKRGYKLVHKHCKRKHIQQQG
jgi:hypothetical protein